MTDRLASALRETADTAPAYDVLDGAITLGRRRRRRSRIGSAAALVAVMAVMTVVALPVAYPPAGPQTPAAQPWAATVSLPERISAPDLDVDSLTSSPPGATGVIFAETQQFRIVTVGAVNDIYRAIVSAKADPGRTALLSPDGDQLAYVDGSSVGIADLTTGAVNSFVAPSFAAETISPAAWLPDSASLIMVTVSNGTDDKGPIVTTRLIEVNPVTGRRLQFAEATWPIAPAGFAVAVSPDGTRIAYQYSDFITIYDRATSAKQVFTVPERSVLAGKGAWTPDGRELAVVRRDAENLEARRWQLLLLDPATGVERDPANRPAMSGVSLVRLLGWQATNGRPVVAGYHALVTADSEFALGQNPVSPDQVEQVGVYELSTSGTRTLLEPEAGVIGLDVADLVTRSGLSRPGIAATKTNWLTIGGIVALVVVAGLLCWAVMARARRSWRVTSV